MAIERALMALEDIYLDRGMVRGQKRAHFNQVINQIAQYNKALDNDPLNQAEQAEAEAAEAAKKPPAKK